MSASTKCVIFHAHSGFAQRIHFYNALARPFSPEKITLDVQMMAMTQDANMKCLEKAIGGTDVYRCITRIRSCLIENPTWAIESIILFGGLIRDLNFVKGWSDIDIIAIFRSIPGDGYRQLGHAIKEIESEFKIRVDLIPLMLSDIEDCNFQRTFFSSGILNAIAMRDGVSLLIYGKNPKAKISTDQEKAAAIFYLSDTMVSFREFMYRQTSISSTKENFLVTAPRVTRWTFSIVRASLRLFDVYSHPYDESVTHIIRIFPEIDTDILTKLIHLRKNLENCDYDFSIIYKAFDFCELYSKIALRRYFDYAQISGKHG